MSQSGTGIQPAFGSCSSEFDVGLRSPLIW
jgi:hypothetical protein